MIETFQSLKPVYRRNFVDGYLDALTTLPAAALIGATPKVRLFTGPLLPSPDNALADFTAVEATFVGYTAATPTAPIGITNPNGGTRAQVYQAAFQFTGTPPGESISGYWFEGGTPNNWVVAEALPTPFPFGNSGDALGIVILIPAALIISLQ